MAYQQIGDSPQTLERGTFDPSKGDQKNSDSTSLAHRWVDNEFYSLQVFEKQDDQFNPVIVNEINEDYAQKIEKLQEGLLTFQVLLNTGMAQSFEENVLAHVRLELNFAKVQELDQQQTEQRIFQLEEMVDQVKLMLNDSGRRPDDSQHSPGLNMADQGQHLLGWLSQGRSGGSQVEAINTQNSIFQLFAEARCLYAQAENDGLGFGGRSLVLLACRSY